MFPSANRKSCMLRDFKRFEKLLVGPTPRLSSSDFLSSALSAILLEMPSVSTMPIRINMAFPSIING